MRRASTLALVTFLLASASAALPPLRCCAVVEEPMISCKLPGQESEPEYRSEPLKSTSSENCSFNGLAIFYYHLLTKAMPEFKCTEIHLWETVRAENKGLNLDIYNGFTGFTQYLKNCDDGILKDCTCNIGVGGFTRNSERERNVDAVAPFVFDSLSVIQSVENFDSKRGFWFFFSPFDGRVWLGIFSLVVGVIIIMLLDQDYHPPNNAETAARQDEAGTTKSGFNAFLSKVKAFLVRDPALRKIRFAVLSVIFAFTGHIFDAPSKKEPTGRQRLLLLVTLLLGTFLVLAYEASLVLNLFIGDSSNNYRGVEDIFNCKVKDSEICFPGDGNTQSFWDEVATPLRDISGCTSKARVIRGPCEEGEKQEKRFDKVKSGLDLVKKYGDGKTKSSCTCRFFLGSTSAAAYLLDTEEFCSEVTSIGEPFYTNLLGFVLPPNSTWTADLSKKTLQASSSLSIPSPMEYGRSKKGTNLNACTFNDESRLTFSALRGFFIVAWSFLSVVFLFMCISIVTRLMSEKCGPSAEAVVP